MRTVFKNDFYISVGMYKAVPYNSLGRITLKDSDLLTYYQITLYRGIEWWSPYQDIL